MSKHRLIVRLCRLRIKLSKHCVALLLPWHHLLHNAAFHNAAEVIVLSHLLIDHLMVIYNNFMFMLQVREIWFQYNFSSKPQTVILPQAQIELNSLVFMCNSTQNYNWKVSLQPYDDKTLYLKNTRMMLLSKIGFCCICCSFHQAPGGFWLHSTGDKYWQGANRWWWISKVAVKNFDCSLKFIDWDQHALESESETPILTELQLLKIQGDIQCFNRELEDDY